MKTWRRFDPEATGGAWNPWNAAWLAECALEAYGEHPRERPRLREAFEDVRAFSEPETHTQGFVAWAGDYAVLAFRGTEPDKIRDLLTDADARLVRVPWASGRVHAGAARAVESAWLSIAHILRLWAPPGKRLFLCGHSLGGMLAVLAAAKLERERRPVAGVATFGQPRVGSKRFNASVSAPWLRVVRDNDPAPLLPPAGWLPPRYAHGGRLAWLSGGAVHLGAAAAEGYRSGLRPGSAPLSGHGAIGYLRAIEATLPRPGEG